ncbi:hypothetical protein E2C01_051996 [Portunus trituberculatus]|uniref:Uncharacterized protein n=1 Tax=Portunus trituberculatus TaxID=210409 RepID=A0A5B7GKT2_PORTR|nr:hypothetical protein [Portunus trituberculatus]
MILHENYRQKAEECCFSQDCSRTIYRYYGNTSITGIASNTVSEWYCGSCEKGDDRALYTTKCAAV